MSNTLSAEVDVPVWARSSAFLLKPDIAPYGYIDSRGRQFPAVDEVELLQSLEASRNSFDFVWTPAYAHLVVPEQLDVVHGVLRKRQRVKADIDISNGLRMSVLFGLMLLWTSYSAYAKAGGDVRAVLSSQFVGVSALLFFIFGFLPYYSGWKLRRYIKRTKQSCLLDEVPDAQFDVWLRGQKIPVTYGLVAGLLLCVLIQFFSERGGFAFYETILQAGLLKTEALKYPHVTDGVAWWRVFTAPMLHGNWVHFLMNASGILYLGRRVELLARWPHLLMVFFVSVWAGGLASFHWIPNKIAVGASGGLMGLLGFLLIFETLHNRLVPRPARRRLLAGVFLVAVTGVLGLSFIDNAAHMGGLISGMVYAMIVFPPSSSFHRPVSMKRDKFGGYLVSLFLVVMMSLAVLKMLRVL